MAGLRRLFSGLSLWGQGTPDSSETNHLDAPAGRDQNLGPAALELEAGADSVPLSVPQRKRVVRRPVAFKKPSQSRAQGPSPSFTVLRSLRRRELLGSAAAPRSIPGCWRSENSFAARLPCAARGGSDGAVVEAGERDISDNDNTEVAVTSAVVARLRRKARDRLGIERVAGHCVCRRKSSAGRQTPEEWTSQPFWAKIDRTSWKTVSWIESVELARVELTSFRSSREGREGSVEQACITMKNLVMDLSAILNAIEADLSTLATHAKNPPLPEASAGQSTGSASGSDGSPTCPDHLRAKAVNDYRLALAQCSTVLFEAADILVTLLWRDRPLLSDQSFTSSLCSAQAARDRRLVTNERGGQVNADAGILALHNEILFALRELCVVHAPIGRWYGQQTRFVLYLFEVILRQDVTFFNGTALIEELLAASPRPFDLTLVGAHSLSPWAGPVFAELSKEPFVDGFADLILHFTKRQMGYFSRVLGLTLFDHDSVLPDSFLDRVSNPAAIAVANSICGLRLPVRWDGDGRDECETCCCSSCSLRHQGDPLLVGPKCRAERLRKHSASSRDGIGEVISHNHRVVLAIPGLLERIVSLVRVPTVDPTVPVPTPPNVGPNQHAHAYRRTNWVEHMMELAPSTLDLLASLIANPDLNTFEDVTSFSPKLAGIAQAKQACNGISCTCCELRFCPCCGSDERASACHGDVCSRSAEIAQRASASFPLPAHCTGTLCDESSMAYDHQRQTAENFERVQREFEVRSALVPDEPPQDVATLLSQGQPDAAAMHTLLHQPATNVTDAALQLYQAEILMTLTSLLSPASGSRQVRTISQVRAIHAGLLERLAHPFGSLTWTRPAQEGGIHSRPGASSPDGDAPSCDCVSPEAATKLQYLRCLMNLADGGCSRDVKSMEPLVSKAEQTDIRQFSQVHATLDNSLEEYFSGQRTPDAIWELANVLRPSTGIRPVANQGLLSAVASLHMTGCHSFFRFAIANVIEEFLIGTATPLRSWVASLDFLPALVDGLARRKDATRPDATAEDHADAHSCSDEENERIDCGNSKHNHIRSQTSFDILGELCKFNLLSIAWLESELSDPNHLDTFCSRFAENVVESSLFIRSFLLTLEWLDARTESVGRRGSEILSNCVLAARVWDQRVDLSARMLEEVSVSKISQDNICCITTVLLFCRRILRLSGEDGLVSFFEEIASASVSASDAPKNIMELLCFWGHFYSFSSNDGAALARSSGMPMCVWTQISNTCIRVLRDHFQLRVFTPAQLGAAHLGKRAICFDE